MSHSFKITKHLITFKRGTKTLLLNGATIKPLVVETGSRKIMGLLKDVNGIDDPELLSFLRHHDIIVPADDPEDFSTCTSRCGGGKKGNGATKTHGMSLYMLLSQGCNLGCKYCLNGEKTYDKAQIPKMDERVAFKGIERLSSAITENGSIEIVFFGGEPLLNWPLAKQTILFCEERLKKKRPDLKVRYHLTSNLTLCPPDLIEWAKKYHLTFLCNIDGPRPFHDRTRPFKNGRSSLAASAKTIGRLREAGLSVALRTTVTADNMHHIKEISAFHKELGGAGSAFVPVNAINSDEMTLARELLPEPEVVVAGLRDLIGSGLWQPQDIFPLNEYLKRIRPGERNVWGCGAPLGNTPVLDVNGDIYACIYLVGIPRYRTGNIFSRKQLPDRKVVESMMELINIDNSSDCRGCQYRYLCGGGCPVGRFLISGNPSADSQTASYTREMSCALSKAMIEETLWLLAKEARKKQAQEAKAGCM